MRVSYLFVFAALLSLATSLFGFVSDSGVEGNLNLELHKKGSSGTKETQRGAQGHVSGGCYGGICGDENLSLSRVESNGVQVLLEEEAKVGIQGSSWLSHLGWVTYLMPRSNSERGVGRNRNTFYGLMTVIFAAYSIFSGGLADLVEDMFDGDEDESK